MTDEKKMGIFFCVFAAVFIVIWTWALNEERKSSGTAIMNQDREVSKP